MDQKDTRNRAGRRQGDGVAKRNQPDPPAAPEGVARVREDWIAGQMRRVREEALRDEIPERMRSLLDQLDRLDQSEEEDPS